MKIIIHRGSHEIGGTCIQLSTARTTILLDLGLPLSKKSKEIELSAIKPGAVLISHPHQDHYGLIDQLDRSVPVYIGEVGKNLIDATRVMLRKSLPRNNFQYFESWKPFVVGDFRITPYFVDHSASDAYAFLIEAVGKRIFYSGDFRAHGRKSVLFEKIIKHPPKDIDLLFMEGTMLGRDNIEFPFEEAVEKKILETIKSHNNITFLISSSQNIYRIVSAYRACLRAKKTLVLDFYTAWVHEQVQKKAKGVPGIGWDNIMIYADKGQDTTLANNPEFFGSFRRRAYKYRVTHEELKSAPENYLYLTKMSRHKLIARYKRQKPVNIIYSQWQGYLQCTNDEYYGAEEISTLMKDPMVHWVNAHTSGHATVEDLRAFAKSLNPKMLVPVHTEHEYQFAKYFKNVIACQDRNPIKLL